MKKIKKTSSAFRVLQRVVDLGGSALPEQMGKESIGSMASMVRSLEDRLLIFIRDGRLIATPAGKLEIAQSCSDSKDKISAPLQVAAPRTIQNGSNLGQVLNLGNMFASVRPDGLTFRSEPSLMGATRKLPTGEIVD